MSAVTLITLGVADVAEATAFYEEARLREVEDGELRKRELLSGRGVVLALWGRDAQRTDANAGELWNGNGGIAVAQNVASEADVDALMAKAEAAGARILKPAAKTFWGGYDGYSPIPMAISGRSPSIRVGPCMRMAGSSCRND